MLSWVEHEKRFLISGLDHDLSSTLEKLVILNQLVDIENAYFKGRD